MNRSHAIERQHKTEQTKNKNEKQQQKIVMWNEKLPQIMRQKNGNDKYAIY